MESEKRPLFSVIVPVYKVEMYLHQCVDSILEQSFSDFEVILVDDGSPDCSGAICDEYAAKDSRVRAIHKKNGGNVSARRAGYAICQGRYIVHVDSDDYIAPGLLAAVAEKIGEYGVDAVLFGFTRFDENGTEEFPQGIQAGLYVDKQMDAIKSKLILGEASEAAIYNGLWSLVMRREIFEPHLEAVPESIYRGEDMAAVVPAIAHCSAIYVLDMCGYHYRNTPGSIMNTYRGDELEQAKRLAGFLKKKMGPEYAQRLDSYVLKACFEHLKNHAVTYEQYQSEVRKILDPDLRGHLKGARCGEKAHISDRLVFFLLRSRLFWLLWLIWKVKT